MSALIKKNIRMWRYGTLSVLSIGCLLFSISGRMGGQISFEQHILSSVSDHYYLTYLALPVTLFSCFFFIEDDGPPVISRFGSYRSYFCKKWLGVGIIAFLLVVIQTLAILLSSLGAPLGNNWDLVAGATETELFSVLETIFSSPLQAFTSYSIYQLIGTWLIFGICMWICHFCGRKWTTRIVVLLYILSVLWIMVPLVQTMPITTFGHLFILHHNLITSHRLMITIVTLLILAAIIVISVCYAWRGKLPRFELSFRGLSGYYLRALMIPRNLLVLLIVVVGIAAYKLAGDGIPASETEWIYTLFFGHGTGYFQLLPFLEMLMTGVTPLYLLAIFVEQTVAKRSIYVSIRSKGRRHVMRSILSVSIKFLMIYAALWAMVGLIGMLVSGPVTIASMELLLYAVSMKFLDISVQYLIMITIYLFTGQVTSGFLVLVVGHLLCILSGELVAYLPFGLSALARISIIEEGIGISALSVFGILAVMAVVLMIVIFTVGYKKILD